MTIPLPPPWMMIAIGGTYLGVLAFFVGLDTSDVFLTSFGGGLAIGSSIGVAIARWILK